MLDAQVERFISPRRLVVATDLTDLDRLLPHVQGQAHGPAASVTFVHVRPLLDNSASSETTTAGSESDARAFLSGSAKRLREQGIDCSIVVRHGAAAQTVLEEIASNGATRLLIASHLHGHTGQTMIGTVAGALLRNSSVPVFVVPPGAPAGAHVWPRRILHATSLSEDSRDVAKFAIDLSRRCCVELTILHVMSESLMHSAYVRELFAARNRQLDEMVACSTEGSCVHTVLAVGEPVAETLRVAAEIEADWLLMGIEHDYPWWSMNTSAVSQVISEAQVPVLVVRRAMIAGGSNAASARAPDFRRATIA